MKQSNIVCKSSSCFLFAF